MRRAALLLLVSLLILPVLAQAAGGVGYSNKTFGFRLVYPHGWHVSETNQPPEKHVLFFSTGKRVFAFDVGLLTRVKQGSTIRATLANFTSYEKKLKNIPYEKANWTRTTLGGRPAEFTVIVSGTEGGVIQSEGTILTGAKGRGRLVTFAAYGQTPLKRLGQFNAQYRNMLSSWHWTK